MSRKSMLLTGALLAGAALALGFYWPFRSHKQVLRLPGVVEVHEVRLGPRLISGRVAEVKAREGDLVEEGQPLVILDVHELRAQLEQQQARLAAAEAELEKAHEGARPQEKDAALAAAMAAWFRWQRLDAGARPEEIRQAQSELEVAEADLKHAEEEFRREERLGPLAGRRMDYDAAVAARARARGRLGAARERLNLLQAGSRAEEVAEAAADFGRLWHAYDLLLAGTRSQDLAAAEARAAEARAKLKELEAHLAEAIVRAPSRSIVEVLAVRKGDLVAPNQPVVRVLCAEDMWVKVYVPETELGKVRLGQTVEVTVDSHPHKRFAGTVVQIASVSEFTPRNVQSADERKHQVFGVKVRVDDPQGVFKSGMAAEVILPVEED